MSAFVVGRERVVEWFVPEIAATWRGNWTNLDV